MLYCLDPDARGRIPVERFAEAAGRAGWIVGGSNNSRNGPLDIAREAIGSQTVRVNVRGGDQPGSRTTGGQERPTFGWPLEARGASSWALICASSSAKRVNHPRGRGSASRLLNGRLLHQILTL
jgi:hypothetical protein